MDLSYNAAGRTEMLKSRAKRCVCKYCGSRLSIRRITFSDLDDARIEIFCRHCDRIEFGVEQEIYQSARYFVEEMGFNYYPDLAANEMTKHMNIAKVCEIMSWENKHLGILSKSGFTVPLQMNANMMGKSVILTDADVAEIEEIMMGTVEDVPND